jgi:hypothetical protein
MQMMSKDLAHRARADQEDLHEFPLPLLVVEGVK